jgi:AbrB family looped-hinge helix DNA binding protein
MDDVTPPRETRKAVTMTEGHAVAGRAQLRKNSQLTLPATVRQALHIEEGDEVEFQVTASGEVVLRGLTTIPADQRWFWTEQWQAGEREASEQIARGEVTIHDSVDDMFAHLTD